MTPTIPIANAAGRDAGMSGAELCEVSAASPALATEKFEVRNRWTNRVQFTAEITCSSDATIGVKLGLAVRWGRQNGAVLRGADMSGADMSGADMSGADMRGADMSGADMRGAVLRGADMRGAVLRDADMSGADMSGADMRGAVLRDADMSGADMSGADMRDANMSGANMSGANMSGADMRDANMSDAVLRSFKADMWMALTRAQAEIPALISALRDGRVNGSQYEGECACLVGTLANARGAIYIAAFPDASSRHPAEQWFLMIREGDKAGDDSAGGFAASKALEWSLEYCALTGIDPVAQSATQAECAK